MGNGCKQHSNSEVQQRRHYASFWLSGYLPHYVVVVAGAEGGDDTHTIGVSVKPLLTDTALVKVAAVDRGGVNIPTAPLTQWDLLRHAHLPLLSSRARCREIKQLKN